MDALQHLDLLAEFGGQRRGGLLRSHHGGGVDGVVLVVGELVRDLFGLPLALRGQARARHVGVDDAAGVGLGLRVPDERHGDAVGLR